MCRLFTPCPAEGSSALAAAPVLPADSLHHAQDVVHREGQILLRLEFADRQILRQAVDGKDSLYALVVGRLDAQIRSAEPYSFSRFRTDCGIAQASSARYN